MWIPFIAFGLTACALVALYGTIRRSNAPRSRWIVALLLLLVGAGLIIALTSFRFGTQTLSEEAPWFDRTPYREGMLFLFMLGGMVARFVTLAIEERRSAIKARAASSTQAERMPGVPIRFDIWELVYPMMVSVITFGVLLKQIDASQLSVASIVMSFQTGFFWQTILTRAEGRANA